MGAQEYPHFDAPPIRDGAEGTVKTECRRCYACGPEPETEILVPMMSICGDVDRPSHRRHGQR